MKRHFWILSPVVLMFVSILAFAADEVVSATNDDVKNFDKAIQNQHRVQTQTRANFGQTVSEQAKAKNQVKEENKARFGQTVSKEAKAMHQEKIQNKTAMGKGSKKVKGVQNCTGDACGLQIQTKAMEQTRERKGNPGTGNMNQDSNQGSSQGQSGSSGSQGSSGSGGRQHGRN